jgi:acyl-CoA synthetase (NDP forming)
VGNKADISGNDLLEYWSDDPNVDLILLYLESFGNPRRFSRIAPWVARKKPIVAIKSGRSPAGARAAGSHTGALLAASDTTVDALFRGAGVIRTNTLEEMFDVASLLAHQPVPRGRRVAIVTNAGGPGILCADACSAEGLSVAPLGEATQARLRGHLPQAASVENPVDMIATASGEHYRNIIAAVGDDTSVDAIIAIYIPPLAARPDDVGQAILDGTRALGGKKPLLTVFMQARGLPDNLAAPDLRVASYAFPENAAIALSHAVRYGEWLGQPERAPARLDGVRRDEARALVTRALERNAAWLGADDVWTLLSCFGLPLVQQRMVTTPGETAAAARELGGELVLKASAPGLLHKTDVGAVRVGLSPEAVPDAALEMQTALRSRGFEPDAFALQRKEPAGTEMLVGAMNDPQFGPVVACGAGGTFVELTGDVTARLAPLAREDALEMIRELRIYPALTGYRGAPPRDIHALADVVVRIGSLMEELPEIQELDLNPVRVYERGVMVVDARVRVSDRAASPFPVRDPDANR